jgi:hypothetical protein
VHRDATAFKKLVDENVPNLVSGVEFLVRGASALTLNTPMHGSRSD